MQTQLANFITARLQIRGDQGYSAQYAPQTLLNPHHIWALEAILTRHPVFH
jgi:hypothetical protein